MLKKLAVGISAFALVGAGVLASAPASYAATQEVKVNCLDTTAQDFSLTAGDVIVFDVSDASCVQLMNLVYDMFAVGSSTAQMSIHDDPSMQYVIDMAADTSGTGGSAVASYGALTVTYTAGDRDGTDSLRMAPPSMPFEVGAAADFGSNDFFMTVGNPPAAADNTPPSWFQSYGRHHAEDMCDAGWSPSWAEWMNNHNGGFVCNREIYWDKHTHGWATR